MKHILPKEKWESFKNSLSLERRPVSFRVNTLRSDSSEIEKVLEENNINYISLPFWDASYILENHHSERDLWNLDIYKEGKIYIQGISSQFPACYFERSDTPKNILDACAAPGWKTSQLSARFPDSQIWAFEPNPIRYKKLCHNLEKQWCSNVTVIQDSAQNIQKHISKEDFFDFILVDAPCSGEWAINIHNDAFLESWDMWHIKRNYKRQKSICSSLIPYLKGWGEMIYSTCTLAPEENEAVVHFLLCQDFKLSLKNIDFLENNYINFSPALKTFEKYHFKKEISERCLRVIPSEYSEWFFIAKMQKWAL